MSGSAEDENLVTIAVVGDSFVGKTSLIYGYADNSFPDYSPTVCDVYTANQISYGGTLVRLSIWDLSSNPGHQKLRMVAYSKANVVLFCFSLADTAVKIRTNDQGINVT